ncbi:MAG: Acetylglutamate kinase [Verrucomicrobia bacterium ADurb.Bin474]|nr:MAG: Acetylglutamate kinase [Verrucomicrobia bacterium ADurb.Bin474]
MKPDNQQYTDAISKANVLMEAMPYLQRFRDSVFVVKYGGAFMDDPDPDLRKRVAADITFLSSVGIHVVVVHGGGKAISRAMETAGIEVEFRNGFRYTSSDAMKIVERTLNDEINSEICAMISEFGGSAQGIRGNDVLRCKRQEKDGLGNAVDLGFVGEITDVRTDLIRDAISRRMIPVVSPVAVDVDGNPYNTNADIAASKVASAMGARRLVFLCDVAGLLLDPKDPSTLISSLKVSEVAGLISRGIIGKGMLPKVDGACMALTDGVKRVHFVDGYMPHSILLEIFTNKGIGTEIVGVRDA